ncbi:MAG: hypothetical protein AB1742_05450 [bacterium]
MFTTVNTGPLPPIMRDPSILAGIVRRRVRRAAPMPAGWYYLPSAATPDVPETMESLQEEIAVARPILDNLHFDVSVFAVRDRALDSIIGLLSKMRAFLEERPVFSRAPDELRADLDALAGEINDVALKTRYNEIPLLTPFDKVVATGEAAPPMNRADVVFVAPRTRRMRAELNAVARNVPEMALELSNRGVVSRLGLLTYDSASHPGGVHASVEEFQNEIYRLAPGTEGVENGLQALQDALRLPLDGASAWIFVILSDLDAADDFADMRAVTLRMLGAAGVTVFALSANDPYTRVPFGVYSEITGATGGAYYNIDRTPYPELMPLVAADAARSLMNRGANCVRATEREIPLGPGPGDTLRVRLPDFRPDALGIENLPLDTEEDFVAAVRRIVEVIGFAVTDRAEKNVLRGYLHRILDYFHNTRSYQLDFHC